MTIRANVSMILEARRGAGSVSLWINGALVTLILLNVAAVMLATMQPIYSAYQFWFDTFEWVSVVIFTIEYLARVWSVPDNNPEQNRQLPVWKVRAHYLVSPMALVDLLAVLPFYLGLFISLDLRFLRVIRLIRVVKIGRYSHAMQMLLTVFKQEYRILTAALFILLILMVVASSGIYLIEHDVQPDAFGSIPQAMWWAMATLTTVGYGDVTPITPLGKLFGGTITVISMAMVALPAGILASSFSNQLRKRREKFRARVAAALQDGKLDIDELAHLESLRKSLGLEKEDAEALFSQINASKSARYLRFCPHCGEALHDHSGKKTP